ncbi:exo-alpha-sialidase [Kineococcus gynurae]|uniref:Exo-alpha-sialidase n=1 Tax=Kineococcus gynurae TaxID=452979 RepID=A0ABV5LP27_9ACTN
MSAPPSSPTPPTTAALPAVDHPDREPLVEHDGILTGFLPAPTVQCHAANLARLPTGDLACTWFGGTQEGVADIDVWLSRLTPGTGTWSPPEKLSDDPRRSEQNPILWTTPSGEVWLLHTAQTAGDQDTAFVRLRVSTDGGVGFGPARTLFPADERGGVFVRQPPVVTASGRWLVPVFRCPVAPGARWRGDDDDSVVMVSEDEGASWSTIEVPDSRGMVHMNVVGRPDGSLVAFYRSRWADAVHRSESFDEGRSWSVPMATGVPNNNSSIQVSPAADGTLLLVHNPVRATPGSPRRESLYDEIDEFGVAEGERPGPPAPVAADDDRPRAVWGTPRAPMRLSASTDAGRTWPVELDLEVGDGNCLTNDSRAGANHELSYPSVLVESAPDGSGVAHVAWTWHRRAIRYARVPLSRLRS